MKADVISVGNVAACLQAVVIKKTIEVVMKVSGGRGQFVPCFSERVGGWGGGGRGGG